MRPPYALSGGRQGRRSRRPVHREVQVRDDHEPVGGDARVAGTVVRGSRRDVDRDDTRRRRCGRRRIARTTPSQFPTTTSPRAKPITGSENVTDREGAADRSDGVAADGHRRRRGVRVHTVQFRVRAGKQRRARRAQQGRRSAPYSSLTALPCRRCCEGMMVVELPGGHRSRESGLYATNNLTAATARHHGLTADRLQVTDQAVEFVIRGYTRETGVWGLATALGDLCAKVVRRRAERDTTRVEVTPGDHRRDARRADAGCRARRRHRASGPTLVPRGCGGRPGRRRRGS